jgi:hypothetical protein
MSTGILITIIVAVVVVLIVLALVLWTVNTRRRRLKERFGPEYERAVQTGDSRRSAEQDLRQREERHDALEIRALPPAVHDRYAEDWASVQERFVDRPYQAVDEADRLVITLMSARGYPTEEGYEQQLADLSVEHGKTLEHYRIAHEIHGRTNGQEASTEELRRAMVHYRALFEELLKGDAGQPAR